MPSFSQRWFQSEQRFHVAECSLALLHLFSRGGLRILRPNLGAFLRDFTGVVKMALALLWNSTSLRRREGTGQCLLPKSFYGRGTARLRSRGNNCCVQ